ncbi:MAG: hypothetical protein GX195_07975 [Firmicutes bacterium]|nr:hypothetical protein [Bacillota bacterium]
MSEFCSILLDHWRRYPRMAPADFVKLVFQSEYGTGHYLPSPEAAWDRLKQEYVACQRAGVPRRTPPLVEEIGGEYCRVNLQPLPRSGISLNTVARWFAQSSRSRPADETGMERKLDLLLHLSRTGQIHLPLAELAQFIAEYKKAGFPAQHHSAVYRELYRPAYRVVRRDFVAFARVFAAIDTLAGRESQVLVAIDGNSGAGKSRLAELLAEVYDCNVFHMDDFFLPGGLKTATRLSEPGGNVHYERFAAEVLQGLAAQRPFAYGVFDCRTQRITREVNVVPKRVNIIEGSYSMHPAFGAPYHLRVFLQVDEAKQRERILRRSGDALLRRFEQEWIPLENSYFEAFRIKEQADLVYQT